MAYWAIAGLAIVTAIGTYERSALIGLVVLGAYMWVRTTHKIKFGLVIAVAAVIMIYSTSSGWNSRVSTINIDYQSEGSAYVRILVWKWTLNYVASNPFGGGFDSYVIDHIEVPGSGPRPAHEEFGRAFHSIYFEVLGEHGYPGIAIFLGLAGSTFLMLRRLARRARDYPELRWVVGLSDALQSGLAVFLSSGAFVGIAFQPMFWYFISMSVSLNAYMWRVERQQTGVLTGWRAVAGRAINGRPTAPAAPNWRRRPAVPNLGVPPPIERFDV